MPTRPCAGPTPGRSCPTRQLVTARPGAKQPACCFGCQRERQRAKDARRPLRRTGAEQQRRRAAVAEHVAVHGYVCPGCPPYGNHPHFADPVTNPLTAEHVIAVGAGGPEDGPLRVLCRSGNSALGATVRRSP
jgi:hypothetical protein